MTAAEQAAAALVASWTPEQRQRIADRAAALLVRRPTDLRRAS